MSSILKHIDLGNRHIFNTRWDPIVYFHPGDLVKYDNIEKGMKKLDKNLLVDFKHPPKELCPKWYKSDKQFKHRPKGAYPTTSLRNPYQYTVVILCRLYRKQDTSQFSLSYLPLIYYYVDEGESFNWGDILSANLAEDVTVIAKAQPRTFPSFHMASYLLCWNIERGVNQYYALFSTFNQNM